jgi:hypothetical protein
MFIVCQVCGTDGKTYNSEKGLIVEACDTGKSGHNGLKVDYKLTCVGKYVFHMNDYYYCKHSWTLDF